MFILSMPRLIHPKYPIINLLVPMLNYTPLKTQSTRLLATQDLILSAEVSYQRCKQLENDDDSGEQDLESSNIVLEKEEEGEELDRTWVGSVRTYQ